jgi:hypothetical protein
MANSNAHKLGQIIGETFELAIYPVLKKFADDHELYLDIKGRRPARPTKKLTWKDINDNDHDLDFVLERNGSETCLGTPVAFIESAWRRYTKHSKNKAQEIQGALDPLAERFKLIKPLKGAILAGEFTNSSLDQLHSLGFGVVHVPYASIVSAFLTQGIDVSFDEGTPEDQLGRKVASCRALEHSQLQSVADAMLVSCRQQIDGLIHKLEEVAGRTVDEIRVLPLFGNLHMFHSVIRAVDAINLHDEIKISGSFSKYEISVRFSNGDKIDGSFKKKSDAIAFLKGFGC